MELFDHRFDRRRAILPVAEDRIKPVQVSDSVDRRRAGASCELAIKLVQSLPVAFGRLIRQPTSAGQKQRERWTELLQKIRTGFDLDVATAVFINQRSSGV